MEEDVRVPRQQTTIIGWMKRSAIVGELIQLVLGYAGNP